jgi:hypothetical protein
MIFSFRPIGRFLAGAALLAAPALLLVPGCGGGGSATPDLAIERLLGVELLDTSDPNNPVIFDRGNLRVGLVDSAAAQKTASGTLQLLGGAAITPNPTPTATAFPTGLPRAGTINLRPSPGSYLLKGTANYTGSSNPFVLNLRGALKPELPFTLEGTFSPGSILVLRGQLKTGSVVIPMRVLSESVPFVGTPPTPVATTTATVSATATTTATTTATPSGTATSTPLFNATPTSTPVSPFGTPVSPVSTPVSPGGSF